LKSPPAGKINLYGVTFDNDAQIGEVQFGQNISQCTSSDKIVCNNSYAVKNDTATNLNSTAQKEFTNLANTNGSQDTWAGLGKYTAPDGAISNTSHQLITVPIFDVCSIPHFCDKDTAAPFQPKAMLSTPSQKIKVIGFARMFVQVLSSGEIRLYLAGLSGCGSYVPDPATAEAGSYGIPVRLVHN
jgi:hypothetical protein